MDLVTDPTAEAAIEVEAPPELVWDLVSDVTRTGEWSPACYRCEWVGEPAAPVVGARFRGHNRLNGFRWSRDCEVTAAERGRVFAFSTEFKGQESTRWCYRFEAAGSGTRLTEAYQIVSVPRWVGVLRAIPGARAKSERDAARNLRESLRRVKALAETGQA